MQEFRLLRRGERHALFRRRQGHATSASVHEGAVLGGVFQVRVSMYDIVPNLTQQRTMIFETLRVGIVMFVTLLKLTETFILLLLIFVVF